MHRWLYAASVGERFDPGRVERYDHETAYENLVNAEAAKFEEERTPSSAELERTSEGVRGMCVVSIVVCLEGDETELFADAAASEPRLRREPPASESPAKDAPGAPTGGHPSSPRRTSLRGAAAKPATRARNESSPAATSAVVPVTAAQASSRAPSKAPAPIVSGPRESASTVAQGGDCAT